MYPYMQNFELERSLHVTKRIVSIESRKERNWGERHHFLVSVLVCVANTIKF